MSIHQTALNMMRRNILDDNEIELTKEEMNVSDEEYKIQKALGSTPTRVLTFIEVVDRAFIEDFGPRKRGT